ncbi:urease accessory protein UreF [Sphaerisporangium aureirubrum]|uniref:urease accessory protein UreF n=1 Tax=Sphaerisporangium aureirubrum TaxID=1544736 RepID=UPI003625034A
MTAALLLLADSRLPAGGHAHSGGAEQAVRTGAITGSGDLTAFLRGRLATPGLVAAALAEPACALAASDPDGASEPAGMPDGAGRPGRAEAPDEGPAGAWRELDAEADARTASPAQRDASRTQGRLLLRSARRIWPSAALDALAKALPEGTHHPIALGAVAAAAGCDPYDAALASAYTTITGPATAAVRLLGLDPVVVHRVLAGLAPELEGVARAGHAGTAWEELPAHAAPALDLLAEQHLRTEVRLFVS